MTTISVEIPITWGTYLREVLENLRRQTFQDFEIVASVSSHSTGVKDVLSEYGVKFIYSGENILEKRYSAHNLSRGSYSLFLDETRLPSLNLLESLSESQADMVIIKETNIGESIWTKLANLDTEISIRCNDFNPLSGFVLPRYFKGELLNMAFEAIRKKLSSDIFKKILMEDHQIISYEAFQISKSISITDKTLLFHYGDDSLYSIWKKYHKYGKSHRFLKNTNYDFMLSTKNRMRKNCLGNEIQMSIFYIARGLPFLMGYYFL